MKIAILGWGSLIWDQRDLLTQGVWQKGGPVLPIEFSRISSDGRLTLVIDEKNGVPVQTRFAQSGSETLNQAIEDLRKREGTSKSMIGVVSRTIVNAKAGSDSIKAWDVEHKWDGVIWTGLPSNFEDIKNVPFTIENGLTYLRSLAGEKKAKAREYIDRAPEEVVTPLRRALEKKGWST
ncbi:hypothetical protein EBZ37_04610 [bacterium]|nr:hypothetical protein [bacterium]